ncbi:MAG: penicillin acylase family protein, partial [Bacteroidetes bacterium]|nr:penicillin acylase family protein [Bacteroidota bacterium]
MRFFLSALFLAALLVGLNWPISGAFRLGPFLEPVDGLWSTARHARPWESDSLFVDGMQDPVFVTMDERGVPHIRANSDMDAMAALGYVVVRDRLFETDFIHRVSTGQLAALLGPDALRIDRYFRDNGIVDAVRRNTELMADRMPRETEAVDAYMRGANAWLGSLTPEEWPLEYRLLGAEPPDSLTREYTMALYAYMTYDLSFRSSDRRYASIKAALGPDMFDQLYPEHSAWEKPIVRADEGSWTAATRRGSASSMALAEDIEPAPVFDFPAAEGFLDGKGSNNWAVAGSRSVTGMPILAGDMHLSLTLPAIWYEAHLITPTANVYGVTFAAVPGIVEGITPTTAWAFTNTGSDQIDTYRVQLNAEGSQYLFDGEWRHLDIQVDTIRVKDADPVVHETAFTHFGPVQRLDDGDYVVRWVGHEFGITFAAVWDMNRALNYDEFELAIRQWDYPMQNILYAGRDSVVAIRSTGYMPVRAQGNAFGVLDGTTSDTEWIGRVPFAELPHVIRPAKGYLTSTNQAPAPEGYPHYLGQNWESIYRSIRIDELLDGKQRHSADDLASYHADQVAVQARFLTAPLAEVDSLSEHAERLKRRLEAFDGDMRISSVDARLYRWFVGALETRMWDEAVFNGGEAPKEIRIIELMQRDPGSLWFDIQATPGREDAEGVFRAALEEAAARWAEDDFADVPWGEVQTLEMRHITGAEALRPLWREGYPFGGS